MRISRFALAAAQMHRVKCENKLNLLHSFSVRSHFVWRFFVIHGMKCDTLKSNIKNDESIDDKEKWF